MKISYPTSHKRQLRGFTLLELLVVMGVLSIIFLVTASLLDTSRKSWNRTRSLTEQYRQPRIAFEALTRRLADAKLHTYWDYRYEDGLPVEYVKTSELHFVSGKASDLLGGSNPGHAVFFQAPFGDTNDGRLAGMESLLNAWGYFIQFGSDEDYAPGFISGSRAPKYRFRLMELRPPTEDLTIYASGTPEDKKWFRDVIKPENLNIVAENVVGLIIQPMDSQDERVPLAPNYEYDSRKVDSSAGPENQPDSLHELPPLLKVTMIVVDEGSATQVQGEGTSVPSELDYSSVAPFTNVSNFENDIEAVEEFFRGNGVDYRIFRTVISIRNAKFTGGRDL